MQSDKKPSPKKRYISLEKYLSVLTMVVLLAGTVLTAFDVGNPNPLSTFISGFMNYWVKFFIVFMIGRGFLFRSKLRGLGYLGIGYVDSNMVRDQYPYRALKRIPARDEIAATPFGRKTDVETVLAVLEALRDGRAPE